MAPRRNINRATEQQQETNIDICRRQFLQIIAGAASGSTLAPLMPTIGLARSSARIKEFQFKTIPTQVQLGKGTKFTAWTYNDPVPGLEIRVREGDIVRVALNNELTKATTIHWHGIPLSNPMDGVPGITRPAGSFLHHSHAGFQLDQGLYGSLIIEPSKPEEAYDREFTLVLEDWVLRDGGGTASVQQRPPWAACMGACTVVLFSGLSTAPCGSRSTMGMRSTVG